MQAIYVKLGFKCPNCGVLTEVSEELWEGQEVVQIEEETPTCFVCKMESRF